MVTAKDGERLLALARQALEAQVLGQAPPTADEDGALGEPCGAFVTIRHGRDLRGCLGRVDSDWSLGRVLTHLGAVVANADTRFPPVQRHEVSAVRIEISVLTKERGVKDVHDIEIGRHGLIAEHRGRRGLLLPQVAVEHQWDPLTFVEQTCIKAGLPPDAWRHGARLCVFEAQVFREPDDRDDAGHPGREG